MQGVESQPAALSSIRVLDCAGPAGDYCTKLLAALGADVVRVENTGAPFAHSMPADDGGPDSPAAFRRSHFHVNKRSIELDLRSAIGQNTLRAMLSSADVVIETLPQTGRPSGRERGWQ